MSAKKRMRKSNKKWQNLLKNINFDEYINNIDRGILKFVNKDLYSQYKLFKISLNDLIPYPRAIMNPLWAKLITWYQKMYNCKLKDYDNFEKVIKADYHNIYNLYFCSPSLTKKMYNHYGHIKQMIDNNAKKCIKVLFKFNTLNLYEISECFCYIAKTGNRNMFILFMNMINNNLEKYLYIDHIMNICITEHNENILELLIDTYGYEPSDEIIQRINGPHFNCGLCQAIVLKL